MRKPKKTSPPPAGRILRTNTEITDWIFRSLEWPRRLTRYEAVARKSLTQHPHAAHPRHTAAVGMLSLIAAARAARERGKPIDVLMVAIEHQRAVKFDPRRRPQRAKWDDRLQGLMEKLVRDRLTIQQKDIQAKEMFAALKTLAAPNDPAAVIARVEATRLYWRPQPHGREKRLSLSAVGNRLTWIKAHLADS